MHSGSTLFARFLVLIGEGGYPAIPSCDSPSSKEA